MIDDIVLAGTIHILKRYLFPLDSGPWIIEGACITARTTRSYSSPADAQATRLLIEEPDLGWCVAFEVVQRNGKLWRLRFENAFDTGGSFSPDEVLASYIDWLSAL